MHDRNAGTHRPQHCAVIVSIGFGSRERALQAMTRAIDIEPFVF